MGNGELLPEMLCAGGRHGTVDGKIKGGDEVWVGEKFQSNPEIAGSPRNSFRASLGHESCGGRALNFLGGVKAYRRISNSECHGIDYRESDYTR